MGQGTHCTKMGADTLAENTPNAPKIVSPICLPKPKSWGFSKKTLWMSVVRAVDRQYCHREGLLGKAHFCGSISLEDLSNFNLQIFRGLSN